MVVGITGGLATGKSLVTQMLQQKGAVTFSADEAARAILSPQGQVLKQIAHTFGTGVLRSDGSLDRRELGQIIFADETAREQLNRITHPAILRLLRAQIEGVKADFAPDTAVLVEVPLLFETNLSRWFERIVVVAASEPVQIARLTARDSVSELEARRRLASQWPLSEKIARADHVIYNNGSRTELQFAVGKLWDDWTSSRAFARPAKSDEKNACVPSDIML